MLTELLIAHGVALDSARITGEITFLLQRTVREGEHCVTLDIGTVVGAEMLSADDRQYVFARCMPVEAVRYLIKHGLTLPSYEIAQAAAVMEARKHQQSQTVWRITNSAYVTCHHSIKLPNAEFCGTYYHVA